MRSRLRSLQNRRAFRKVKAVAAEDQMICGTVRPDGKPLYFLMPRNASNAEIEAKAFEVREGRVMEPGEQVLKQMADQRRAS